MPITINGLELYPSTIGDRSKKIGGPIREALNGTGYQKTVTKKKRIPLAWDFVGEDEFQLIRIIWEQSCSDALTVSCSDPMVSGSFLIEEDELAFDALEGDGRFYTGSLTLRER